MELRQFVVLAAAIPFAVNCDLSEPEPGTDEPLTSSAAQALTSWRSDVNGILYPDTAPFGNWTDTGPVYCEPGTWAVGYQMRVESSRGGGLSGNNDDTALNAVRLLCRNPVSGVEEMIAAHEGLFGQWGSIARCAGSSTLRSVRIRIEGSQGSSDDTAANDVEYTCAGIPGTIKASGGMSWGNWSGWYQCPNNTAVCGIDAKFEGSQAGGDDTALNGIRLYCCDLPCNNNGVCESTERQQTCPGDCGTPPYCGDGRCNAGESSFTCSVDCGPPPPYCGDGRCNGGETSSTCRGDCGAGCFGACPAV